MFLYETVAERISQLIDSGTLPPGARIPSVRQLRRQLGVSLSTVLEAYRLLEDAGRIEVRPQSGYYVRTRFPETTPEPRVSRPAASPTRVSLGELVMMVLRHTHDRDLIQLGAGIPNPALLPLKKLHRALTTAHRLDAHQTALYDMPPGCAALRVQIARRMLTAGCELTPDQIVITSGCQEALVLCLRAVCQPGDTVAIESPTYFGILQALEMLGLRALEVPTHPREGVSLEALAFALEHHTIRACLFTTSFGNPLGSCMPESKRRELVEMLARSGVPLIEDDIYADLCFSHERSKAAKAFDREGLVLLCSSYSKVLSPGYRVGWVVPGRYQAEVERLKFVSSVSAPTLPQHAIAQVLAGGGYEHHLRRIRRCYARQVALLVQAVGETFPKGTRVSRPAGGYLVWVEMPASVDALELYEQALGKGITLAPGPIFSPKQRYRNCIRLNAACWSPRIESAVTELGRLAAAMRD